jgi:phosphoglycerate dehydrogenase-like enzyme
MKVLLLIHHRFSLWSAPDWFVERLRAAFPEVEFINRKSYEGAEADLRESDVLVTWSIRPEQFAEAKKLRWIHSPAAAVHAVLIPEVVKTGVIVTNASSVHGPVVAEHTIALLLAMAKRLPSLVKYQQQHVWAQQEVWEEFPRTREVAGATLGLVGVGSIGGEVARRCAALGMKIMAVRQHPERGADFLDGPAASAAVVYGPDELDKMLAQADYVVLAAPVTSSTQALLDSDRLAKMKPDAYLINVGRGALVDETALACALQRKQIGGAALDVFENEPLSPDSPLWDLPNVLITPHCAALTERLWDRHYEVFSENLRRFQAGETLLGVVNKQIGY